MKGGRDTLTSNLLPSLKKPKGEKMENKMRNIIIVLTLLLIASPALIVTLPAVNTAKAALTSYSNANWDKWAPGMNYGNVLQYEWPNIDGAYAPSGTGSFYSNGPAPNAPDILWKKTGADIGTGYSFGSFLYAFDGKLFATTTTNSSGVIALDAFTGSIAWIRTGLTNAGKGDNVAIWKIADNYMIFGKYCLRIDTGAIVWNATPIISKGRSVQFSGCIKWPGGPEYDPVTKIFMEAGRSTAYLPIYAWNMSDPTKPPTLLWDDAPPYYQEMSTPQYGDGVFSTGSYEGWQAGFNATTGKLMWETETKGEMGYEGIYYQGKFIRGGTTDNTVWAFDRLTGKVLWQYNPQRWMGFFACAPAAAYGMVYYDNVDGYLYAIDASTGKKVWDYQGAEAYLGWPIVADGKVYCQTHMADALDYATGALYGQNYYTCLDAFTGAVIWQIPYGIGNPNCGEAIAFGNLYIRPSSGGASGEIWCIGKPNDWSMYRNGPDQTSVGQSGPLTLNPLWGYATTGAVISSPSIVNGKVYAASQDKYVYCVDAYTGALNWKYLTGSRIRSSPAIVNNKVYISSDDGYLYSLDANNGTLLWKKDIGASTLTFDAGGMAIFHDMGPPYRSSPIVVGGKVFVGSLNNYTYCFDANSGTQLWSFKALGPVLDTPVVINNDVYFTSYSNGSIFKLRADTGALQKIIWVPGDSGTYGSGSDVSAYGYVISGSYMYPSPTIIGNGNDRVIYYPADHNFFYAINETSGGLIWRWRYKLYGTRNEFSILYDPLSKYVFMQDQYHTVALDTQNVTRFNSALNTTALLNTTNSLQFGIPPVQKPTLEPNQVWDHYNSREVQVTMSLGRVGPGDGVICYSTDSRIIYCINASNGKTMGSFDDNGLAANGWSTAAFWEGKMYVGNTNGMIYAFSTYPTQKMYIGLYISNAYPRVSQTVSIIGQIYPVLPNVPVTLSITSPTGVKTDTVINTTSNGYFSTSFAAALIGNHTVVASWAGYKYYASARSDTNYIIASAAPSPEVTPTPTLAPTASPTPVVTPTPTPTLAPTASLTPIVTPTPTVAPTASPTPIVTPTPTQITTNAAFPMEYVYAIVAVVVIVVIVVAAYIVMKRKK